MQGLARALETSLDASFVKPGAIPWVKLDVEHTGAQPGPTGGEHLSRTTFIQRVNTDSGGAPPTGCERPSDIGKRTFVPYTADYREE